MKAEKALHIFTCPRVKRPRFVLAWGCIGEVGIEALTYLRDKLGAEEFGQIVPYDFFNVPLTVKDGLVELQFPRSRLYSWENRDGEDLILLIGEREPNATRYEYANLLVQVAEQFAVERMYTVCAFPSSVSHTVEPRVFGVVNDAKLVKYLEQYGVNVVGERNLTSINALVLSLARQRGFQGIYLLVEVPAYGVKRGNPKSSRAVLKVLTTMLGIDIDMAELEERVSRAEEEMDGVIREASRTFLEDFTIDYRDLWREEEG